MMPLLASFATFHPSSSSKFSYFSRVIRSTGFVGSDFNEPSNSMTQLFDGNEVCLNPRKAAVDVPSNKIVQPDFSSAGAELEPSATISAKPRAKENLSK